MVQFFQCVVFVLFVFLFVFWSNFLEGVVVTFCLFGWLVGWLIGFFVQYCIHAYLTLSADMHVIARVCVCVCAGLPISVYASRMCVCVCVFMTLIDLFFQILDPQSILLFFSKFFPFPSFSSLTIFLPWKNPSSARLSSSSVPSLPNWDHCGKNCSRRHMRGSVNFQMLHQQVSKGLESIKPE